MLKRTISAVLGVPILICIVWKGDGILLAAMAAVNLIALHEFIRAYEAEKPERKPAQDLGAYRLWLWFVSLLSYLMLFLAHYNPIEEGPFLVLALMGLAVIDIFKGAETGGKCGELLFGYVYVTVLFRFIFHASTLSNPSVVWLIFLIAWTTDSFAYFSGNFFGKHKLAPAISPKKTVEGAVGGMLGCAVSTYVFCRFFVPELGLWALLFGFGGSFLSQLGDLAASQIKRRNGIKDFGNLIPGHGGILDRFDSILFTAPYVYLLYVALETAGVIR